MVNDSWQNRVKNAVCGKLNEKKEKKKKKRRAKNVSQYKNETVLSTKSEHSIDRIAIKKTDS